MKVSRLLELVLKHMEDIRKQEESSPYDFPEESIPERYRRVVAMDKQQIRTLDKKHLFLIAYEKNCGNISLSCEEAGIESRKTFYNWCNTDPEFKKAIESSGEQAKRDLIYDLMMLKIHKNHGPTIRWWLSTFHPDYMKKKGPTYIGHNAPYNPFKKYLNRKKWSV